MIFEEGKEPYIVDPASEELRDLLDRGEIKISKEEIKDKGRGDALSKGLILIQTTWFILQCIARKVEHLPITELELVTLAFAALNFVTYTVWWKKPLNVDCPVGIHRKGGGEGKIGSKSKIGTESDGTGPSRGDVEEEIWCMITKDMKGAKDRAIATMVKIGIVMRTLPAAIGDGLRDHVCRYGWHIIWHPLAALLAVVLAALLTALLTVLSPLLASGYVFYISIRLAVGELGHDNVINEGAKGVPTFYVGRLKSEEAMFAAFAAMVVATTFGGIHCAAWSFQFPSHIERLLWRIASIAITSAPFIVFTHTVVHLHYSDLDGKFIGPYWFEIALGIATLTASAVYITGRVMLLVLPFVSLRSLPAEAYQTVQWTTFIPHV